MMTTNLTTTVETLLSQHEYALARNGAICACGHVPTVDPGTLQSQQDYHRTHIATELTRHIHPHPMDRATGGNQFIDAGASTNELLYEIQRGLRTLHRHATETDRHLNLAAVTVVTHPTQDGKRISVSVSGDLARVTA